MDGISHSGPDEVQKLSVPPDRGMTKLDQFAMAALPAVVKSMMDRGSADITVDDVARKAYKFAEAMLKESNRANREAIPF